LGGFVSIPSTTVRVRVEVDFEHITHLGAVVGAIKIRRRGAVAQIANGLASVLGPEVVTLITSRPGILNAIGPVFSGVLAGAVESGPHFPNFNVSGVVQIFINPYAISDNRHPHIAANVALVVPHLPLFLIVLI
jgi:hypothetical protein